MNHCTADGTVKEKKRSRPRPLGQYSLPMPASRLAYDMSGLEAVNLQNAPKRWSLDRCRNCLAKVMEQLKVSSGLP